MQKRLPFSIYALALAAVISFDVFFPIITLGKGVEIAFYFLYSLALGSFGWLFNDQRAARFLAVFFAAATFLLSMAVVFMPYKPWISIAWGASIVMNVLMFIYGLLRRIFSSQEVTGDILLAGIAVYLLLGMLFTPIYTQLETVVPGSFSFSAAMPALGFASLLWTRFLYYSYSTLTTLGYGDITPVSGVAQALAAAEAIVGVLFIAIFMARLVGVYAADVRREEK
jgi:Ion channel